MLFCLSMFCHYFTSEFSVTCQDPISLCMVKLIAYGKTNCWRAFWAEDETIVEVNPTFPVFPLPMGVTVLPIVKHEANSIMNLNICR